MKSLRPHQERSIFELRRSLLRSTRVILQLPTGAGKTVVAAAIFRMARERNPLARVLFVVDAISLIDQTVQAFYDEGLFGIGVIQADHQMTDWSKRIQVASVQTLRRRGMFNADIVVIDECHRQDAWLLAIMQSDGFAHVRFIGLSATPWSKGLGNNWHALVQPTSTESLIGLGLLSPFRVYAAAHPDLTGVGMSQGDYTTTDLSELMSNGNLIADIPATWKRHAEGRPTLTFCVDRAHAKKVQSRFQKAGVPCGYIDAFTKADDRKKIRAQLEAGELKVVANVGCLTTGVDWAIGCIVLARPTKSEMLYVQMVGRGLRVNEGMNDCIILDHADNTLCLGFVTDIHHDTLCTANKGERTKFERPALLPKECSSCAFIKPPKVHECPNCGFKPERRSTIEEEAGELVQIKRAVAKPAQAEKQLWYSSLQSIARQHGYQAGWVSNTYRKRFGSWPRGLDPCKLVAPADEVRRYVQHLRIAYAKSRQLA